MSAFDLSVSIINRTRNEVESIARLISEILAAAVGLHEIVFVDDHSTNGTTDVIRSFATSHPIRLVEQNLAEPGLAIFVALAFLQAAAGSQGRNAGSIWSKIRLEDGTRGRVAI